MTEPTTERRQEERFAPTFRVRTEVLQEEGNIRMAVFADIVNISESGICFRSPLKLNADDQVVFFLPRLDQHLPLEIHGRTVWVKERAGVYEYGMRLAGVSPDQEAKLHADMNSIMDSFFDQTPIRLDESAGGTEERPRE